MLSQKIYIIYHKLFHIFHKLFYRQLKNTEMPKICKIWRPVEVGELTVEHFSTPRRALLNLQIIQRKAYEQAKKN